MARRQKQHRRFECMECGRKLTLKQAERARFDGAGCPGCGGTDIDEYDPPYIIAGGVDQALAEVRAMQVTP